MDRTSSSSPRFHFHIHWNSKENLDWEGFDSHAEALARALEIARPGEMFVIEEISATCPVCEPASLKPYSSLAPGPTEVKKGCVTHITALRSFPGQS